MTVVAKMIGGREFTLAAPLGATPTEVVANLNAASLTGSAVPLADATLETVDGGSIRWTDIDLLEHRP